MQLTLTQCTIRPWRLDDAESLVRHANNRKIWIALRDNFPHPYGIDDAHTFLKAVTNSEPVTLFCVEVDGEATGGIGIRIGADVHRHTAELGYWLSEEFWRRGIMTDAVVAFTDFFMRPLQNRWAPAACSVCQLMATGPQERPASDFYGRYEGAASGGLHPVCHTIREE